MFSEGKEMAMRYDCKYTETSVVLNNGVDELLAGTLHQIRLRHKLAGKAEGKNNILSMGCIQVSQRKNICHIIVWFPEESIHFKSH